MQSICLHVVYMGFPNYVDLTYHTTQSLLEKLMFKPAFSMVWLVGGAGRLIGWPGW